MGSGLWIGVAAAAGALATAIAGRKATHMGQLFEDEEDTEAIDAASGGGHGGGGGGGRGGGGGGGRGGVGVVAGMPGPVGGGGSNLGPVTGHPGPGGRGRVRTTFLFGDGGGDWWPFYYPYQYPAAPNPQYTCQWEETPPKDDTKMICTPQPPAYPVVNYNYGGPVTWGPPNWGWW